MPNFTIQRVLEPSEKYLDASVDLFIDLMSTDLSVVSLVGNEMLLVPSMVRAMLRAGALAGEYYIATNEKDDVIGYTMWMPPGRDLFSTEEQRSLGLNDFMSRLPAVAKGYYKTTYMARFPSFVEESLGPRGKTDAWWLHQAMVRKDYQRQGVCRALINVVLEKAKTKGERLGTTTTNDVNISVYCGLGFEHKGTTIMPSLWGEWPIHVLELRTEP